MHGEEKRGDTVILYVAHDGICGWYLGVSESGELLHFYERASQLGCTGRYKRPSVSQSGHSIALSYSRRSRYDKKSLLAFKPHLPSPGMSKHSRRPAVRVKAPARRLPKSNTTVAKASGSVSAGKRYTFSLLPNPAGGRKRQGGNAVPDLPEEGPQDVPVPEADDGENEDEDEDAGNSSRSRSPAIAEEDEPEGPPPKRCKTRDLTDIVRLMKFDMRAKE